MVNRGLHFLLVEDDNSHAKIIKRVFEKEKISNIITRVKDGVLALEYLRSEKNKNRGKVDVLLLDLNLPKKSGFEILEEIKNDSALSIMPVVILTSSNARHDVERAYKLGANSFLVKPTEIGDFPKLVASLNSYWGTLNSHLY